MGGSGSKSRAASRSSLAAPRRWGPRARERGGRGEQQHTRFPTSGVPNRVCGVDGARRL